MSKILLMERSYLMSFLNLRHDSEKKILDLISASDIKKESRDIFSILGISQDDFSAEKISQKNGSVFEINIKGLLTPSIDILSAFYAEPQTLYGSIVDAIKIGEEDDEVETIQFNVNSPGGYVSGVDGTGNAIKKSKKKTVAVVNDMAASAGYWLASQANKIISKNAADEIGSIGVAVEIFDYTGYYDKFGIKHYSLTSENAENKRPDISTEEGRKQIIDRLSETEKIFHSRVASGRGVSIEKVKTDFGRGGVMPSEKALSVGMIDDVENKLETDFSPATPGTVNKTKKEKTSMETLHEILGSNPGAKADFDKAIAEALSKGRNEANERAEFASKFMTASYPASIQGMAAKVIAGSAMKETLEAMVSMHDEKVASETLQTAQAETEVLPETAGQSNGGSESLDKEQSFQAKKNRILGLKK